MTIRHLVHWYEQYERRISAASLVTGFVVDSLTLQRIDALRENFWIAGNLIVAAVCIAVLNRGGAGGRKHFWFSNGLQFAFGALLGSIFVFYFRSATVSAAWPFLLVLLFAIVGNEIYQKRYQRIAFQLSFLYFSLFSFSIFLVPLLVGQIGPEVFLLSGLVSVFFIWIYLSLLKSLAKERFLEERTGIKFFITAIFIGVNILYFTNLIPPIPLSMKDAGIYHSVSRAGTDYLVTEEKRPFWRFFDRDNIRWIPGEKLIAYTAIFAPGSLDTDIVHSWQYKNERGEWGTATRTPLHLSGGRSGGFRTYSGKENFTPGEWRLDVETSHGQLIGRVKFEIEVSQMAPDLVTVI